MAATAIKRWVLVVLTGVLITAHASAQELTYSPGAHGPAGVALDHNHREGQVMTGYRYNYTRYSGLYHGDTEVHGSELASAGYSMLANSVSMEMTMLDIMYAPSDRLTLMLMPTYITINMNSSATGDMAVDDMSHQVHGFGDTSFSALYELIGTEHHTFMGTLGVNAPTGKTDLTHYDGSRLPYGMQLGSGTWDATSALTYTGNSGALSWGLQGSAVIPLESSNDSGYALGDQYAATVWGAVQVVDWLSFSGRINWSDQDPISGHYKDADNHSSPEDFPGNYGGEFVDGALGVNTVVTGGDFAGLRFGLEWVSRFNENYNGYQLGLNNSVNVSVSYAF